MTITERTLTASKQIYDKVDRFIPSIAKKAVVRAYSITPDFIKNSTEILAKRAIDTVDSGEQMAFKVITYVGDVVVNIKNIVVDKTGRIISVVEENVSNVKTKAIESGSEITKIVMEKGNGIINYVRGKTTAEVPVPKPTELTPECLSEE